MSEARKGLTPRSFFNPKVNASPPIPRQGVSSTHYSQPWHAQPQAISNSKHQSLLGASDFRGTDDSLRTSHTHERAESQKLTLIDLSPKKRSTKRKLSSEGSPLVELCRRSRDRPASREQLVCREGAATDNLAGDYKTDPHELLPLTQKQSFLGLGKQRTESNWTREPLQPPEPSSVTGSPRVNHCRPTIHGGRKEGS